VTVRRILLARLRGLFSSDARISEEIETHILMQAREFEDQGLSPEEALIAARREFGRRLQVRESHRELRRSPLLDSLTQDLRYSVRQMLARPWFTTTALITLALGIGANVAIFHVLDTIVLRKLPVREPEQLVALNPAMSYPLFREMAKRTDVIQGLFVGSELRRQDVQIDGRELADAPDGHIASGSYFQVLGVAAQLGRVFTDADDLPGASPVAVLSDRFWRREFGRDPKVVGQTLVLKNVVAQIVGVSAAQFFGEEPGHSPDFWLPLHLYGQMEGDMWLSRGATWLQPFARLGPGVSIEEAQATLGAFYQNQLGVLSTFRSDRPKPTIEVFSASRGRGNLYREFEKPLWLLMGVVSFVALIGCCNLANLLVARASARSHEIAVRLSMGAGRRRIIRQLLTESVVLATLGGAAGFALALWGSHQLVALAAAGDPWTLDMGINWRVVAFTSVVSVATACIFGFAPALSATRVAPNSVLQANRRSHTSGRSRRDFSRTFMVMQVAVSLVLVAGAALFVQSFWKLTHQDYGYRPKDVLTAQLSFEGTAGFLQSMRLEFRNDLYQRVRAIPGIRSAAISGTGPLGQVTEDVSVALPERAPESSDMGLLVFVSPGYFETLEIPLVAGRGIEEQDAAGAPMVAVISETAARKVFGPQNPIGRRFTNGKQFDPGNTIEIVGVARDIRYMNPRDPFRTLVYLSMFQGRVPTSPEIAIKAPGNAKSKALAEALQQAVQGIRPGVSAIRISTLDEKLTGYLRQERLLAWLSGAFAMLALVLASVGLYGVIAYCAAQRTQEIGVRLALGAPRHSVRKLLLHEIGMFLVVGLVAGIAATLALGSIVRTILYELAPQDPLTLFMAAAVLSAVAIGAAYLPAFRASRMDPMTALRHD
jgi:predicted permease